MAFGRIWTWNLLPTKTLHDYRSRSSPTNFVNEAQFGPLYPSQGALERKELPHIAYLDTLEAVAFVELIGPNY